MSWVLKHLSFIWPAGLGGSVGCAVRLETRRSRVQPPPRSATFFRGDWSWNIFYGHSLPSADSRRAVVSFWRKNVHNTGSHIRGLCRLEVNRLEDYACPVNVWLGKLTALDMTPLGWLGRKTSTQTKALFDVSLILMVTPRKGLVSRIVVFCHVKCKFLF